MKKSIYSRQHQLLCQALRGARNEAKLTQEELAEILERQQSFVAKYELGERRLDLIELLQITDALKIDIMLVIEKVRLAKPSRRR